MSMRRATVARSLAPRVLGSRRRRVRVGFERRRRNAAVDALPTTSARRQPQPQRPAAGVRPGRSDEPDEELSAGRCTARRPDAGRLVSGGDFGDAARCRRALTRTRCRCRPEPAARRVRGFRDRSPRGDRAGDHRRNQRAPRPRSGIRSRSSPRRKTKVVADGQVDLTASAVSITCGRWEQVLFTIPYYEASQKVMVRTDRQGKTRALGRNAPRRNGRRHRTQPATRREARVRHRRIDVSGRDQGPAAERNSASRSDPHRLSRRTPRRHRRRDSPARHVPARVQEAGPEHDDPRAVVGHHRLRHRRRVRARGPRPLPQPAPPRHAGTTGGSNSCTTNTSPDSAHRRTCLPSRHPSGSTDHDGDEHRSGTRALGGGRRLDQRQPDGPRGRSQPTNARDRAAARPERRGMERREAAFSDLWQLSATFRDFVDRARTLRGHQTVPSPTVERELSELLHSASIAICARGPPACRSRSSRIGTIGIALPPDELVARMRDAFDRTKQVVAAVSIAWDTLPRALRRCGLRCRRRASMRVRSQLSRRSRWPVSSNGCGRSRRRCSTIRSPSPSKMSSSSKRRSKRSASSCRGQHSCETALTRRSRHAHALMDELRVRRRTRSRRARS